MTEFKNGTIFKVVDIEAMGMVENLGNDGLPDAWPWLMEALSMAVDADAVVPVELDYEMLMTAAYALVDDVDGLAKYKAFVNKSLGIGDTDE